MTPDAARRGPYAGTAEKRTAISRVVLGVVEELGHDAVTIALIAERTGINEATILYHFPSRDHLLVSAVERADHDRLDESRTAGVLEDFSLDALRASLTAGQDVDRLARLLLVLKGRATTPDHPAVTYFAERHRQQLAIFTAFVARRQRLGAAHPSLDPERVATQFIAMWDGLTSAWIVDPTTGVADLLLDAYRRLAGENVVDARNALDRAGSHL